MNGCEAAGDLVLMIQKIALEKHRGLYQTVTGSLDSSLRPGNLATTVKVKAKSLYLTSVVP